MQISRITTNYSNFGMAWRESTKNNDKEYLATKISDMTSRRGHTEGSVYATKSRANDIASTAESYKWIENNTPHHIVFVVPTDNSWGRPIPAKVVAEPQNPLYHSVSADIDIEIPCHEGASHVYVSDGMKKMVELLKQEYKDAETTARREEVLQASRNRENRARFEYEQTKKREEDIRDILSKLG